MHYFSFISLSNISPSFNVLIFLSIWASSVLTPVFINSCSNKLQFIWIYLNIFEYTWQLLHTWPVGNAGNFTFHKGKKEILKNFRKYKSKNIFDLIRRGESSTNCAPLLNIICKKHLATFVIHIFVSYWT